ncbi:MAG: alanine--tRNA ligase [Thermoflexales bacterium]|nr:alanine--tRNA ligase [Thermoflexales bacterium]
MGSKQLTSAAVRQQFLDFFAERGHTVIPGAPLIPVGDATLLFTNAGMNQFKDVFLGLGSRPYTRVADSQPCMRVAGKHNDLEDVGRDGTHHTLFEMLGNWSFGDYYKQEAIAWAWELLTGVWGLPKERLYATCFKDEAGDLPTDEEAVAFWQQQPGIAPDHILFFGRKDNFWEMGDAGPCGPCSEIHYDRGAGFCDKRDTPGHVCQVNGDCRRFTELWNLVFIQYNRLDATRLEPLPARHVDTGMGFERIVSVLQGVDSNYKTDLFVPILQRIQTLAGHTDAQVQENQVAYQVIADHSRAIAFLIGDGVLPGNVGRKYVLRMIVRRAARFGHSLGFTEPFLAKVVEVVIDEMGLFFPNLAARREHILRAVTDEEIRFRRTLDLGLARLDQVLAELAGSDQKVVPGQVAFDLKATYGLPLEVTRDVALERGFAVDEAGFHAADADHRQVSGSGAFDYAATEGLEAYSNFLRGLVAEGKLEPAGVDHDPYTSTELETLVLGVLDPESGQPLQHVKADSRVEIVVAATPFYVESGGQVSDTGVILRYPPDGGEPIWTVQVEHVRSPVPGLIVHEGQVLAGRPRAGEPCWAIVDYERRWDVMRNHTATHLLHAALRYVLGNHVQQEGSLVAPDRLRFDFTHPGMLTQDQLDAITQDVNDAILANYHVNVSHEPYREAVASGATALFGEKYGEVVRVLRMAHPDENSISQELCGGTHVTQTAQIGSFVIVSESSVGAGLRRIEAVTGHAAQAFVHRRLTCLNNAAAYLGCSPEEVDRKALALLEETQSAQKELARLQRDKTRHEFESLMGELKIVQDVPVLSVQVQAPGVDAMREMTDWFRARVDSGVIVLGAAIHGRPQIVAAVTDDLVQRGVHAGQLVGAVAKLVGGGGGGKPTMAQAGGRDASRLAEALAKAPELVAQMLKATDT